MTDPSPSGPAPSVAEATRCSNVSRQNLAGQESESSILVIFHVYIIYIYIWLNSHGKSLTNGGINRNIIYKWVIYTQLDS